MTMPPQTPPPGLDRFVMTQKITMMVNRYEIREAYPDWSPGPLLAFAQQKRMAFREQVTFYTDEAKTKALFGFRADRVIDLGAGYTVTDPAGAPIGFFKKDFGKSLLRSTWHLQTPDGLQCTGQERSQGVAVARRAWEFVPVISAIPAPFLFHFDFSAPDGATVFSSTKKMGIKDRYHCEAPRMANGWQLDWRVAASMAVALDALQSR